MAASRLGLWAHRKTLCFGAAIGCLSMCAVIGTQWDASHARFDSTQFFALKLCLVRCIAFGQDVCTGVLRKTERTFHFILTPGESGALPVRDANHQERARLLIVCANISKIIPFALLFVFPFGKFQD